MPTLEVGQVFDRYRVVRWLGSGVSGESYEAVDKMLLRTVALKLIHPQTTLPDSSRRQFYREMQGISGLNHQLIAAVLDYGEIDGRLYVARRFTGSGSLLSSEGRLWFRPPLNVSEAIQYAHQLARALHYIHTRGYVHGAVTLSNVLVLRGPNLQNEPDYAPFLLADAGLAQFVRRFGPQPQSLLPVSAAPEQLGRRVIPASDQYALAVLLYSWLAARPPFVGAPIEIERLKLTETITPLSMLNERVSSEQDGVILRALSVSPEDRYPTVLAFTDALRGTLRPTAALPAREPELVVEEEPRELPILPDTPQPSLELYEEMQAEPIEPSEEQYDEAQAGPFEPSEEPQPSEPLREAASAEPPLIQQAAHDAEQPLFARVVIASPYAEEPYEVILHNEEATIGRAGSSDILLDHDNLTSRHHALLRHELHCYMLYDRRSANGVFVNGQRIKEDVGYELIDGDHISIGNYELIFRSPVPAQDHVPDENTLESVSAYEATHLERIS